MASIMSCRTHLSAYLRPVSRLSATRMLATAVESPSVSMSTPSPAPSASSPASPSSEATSPPSTHFKITLRRSGISMGEKIQGTLLALGFHRRHQTVYHRHNPETAGMILKVKELVEVENVPDHLVKTKQQQRQERKAPRGYKVVGSKAEKFMHV